MRRAAPLLVAALTVLASCRTPTSAPAIAPEKIELFAEAPDGGREWMLPQSGVHVRTDEMPVVTAGDITRVQVVDLDLGPALNLDLTPAGAAAIGQRAAGADHRFLLVSDGHPMGVARVQRQAAASRISLFVEMPDAELAAWSRAIATRLRRAQGERE